MKLTHIRLLVADFSECFRFYRDVLVPPLNIGDVNGPYASFLVGGAEIALFNRDSMAEAVGTSAMPSAAEPRTNQRSSLLSLTWTLRMMQS